MSARFPGVAVMLAAAIATVPLVPAAGPDTSRAQTAVTPSAEVALAVYATAVRFYDPPRGQLRWIESPMIVESGALSGAAIDPALLADLLERLGDDFRSASGGTRGSGGLLRVSPIRSVAPDTFRVTVGYRHRTPYFEGPASFQSFLVGRDGERWRILARGPAPDPEGP